MLQTQNTNLMRNFNATFKIFVSFILTVFYLGTFLRSLSSILGEYRGGGFIVFIWSIVQVLILACIVFSIFAYVQDSTRENLEKDKFQKFDLFFRYGQNVYSLVLPIAVGANSDMGKAESLGKMLLEQLRDGAKEYLKLDNRQVHIESLRIIDADKPSDEREFVRIGYASVRKTLATFFINIHLLGNTIIANYFYFFRGQIKWYEVWFFIVTSPVHVWSWFLRWFRNLHSVKTSISYGEYANSYDKIDITSFEQGCLYFLQFQTLQFLEKNGLMTESAKTVIVQQFNGIKINSNNSTLSFGNIGSTIQNAISAK
ncbi:MAG: hypothetical protein SF053_22050 [Bacteroidia bacterium]|nr:hypothetical protein [Bacteroidia bacterium]